MAIAVIDLETTGFSPATGDRIIEIGIVFLIAPDNTYVNEIPHRVVMREQMIAGAI